jgi:formylglycine-generating enzyme required for sulfatase activity
MKRPSLNQIGLLAVLYSALLATGPQAAAQNHGELELHTYAGLTITGEVGEVYSIEYVVDLTEATGGGWRSLEFLLLPASPYLWVDKSAPATGKRFYRAVAIQPPENMVFIKPGTFRMGSPDDEAGLAGFEGPQTEVIISRGFWMGKYEVTQGEYLEVTGTNPSYFNGIPWEGGPDYGTDRSRPVENVSWYDAVAYCAALTQRERAAGRIPLNSVYRLPTEAEWEYACRAGTSTQFSYGDDPGHADLTHYAWYADNSGGTTHPVGQKLPNPWGLHDMHGNVFEWCQDFHSPTLPGGIVLDPQGPPSGPGRVCRGVGEVWGVYAGNCRSAYRGVPANPVYGWHESGFRIVLAPGQP